jgi:hypothetical protein
MNEGGEIVGMVDVLKLTYATLEQINTMGTGDSEGPAWNKFWLSLDHETESMVSGDGSHHHTNPGPRSLMSPDMTRSERLVTDSVAPGDSASHAGVESPPHSAVGPAPELPPGETPFPFKFKAPSGRVHRLQVTAANGMAEFVASVTAKLSTEEAEAIGGAPVVEDGKLSGGYALSYLDDEGDSVSITTDQDLLESIVLARQGRRDKVDLFVHDPKESPVPAAPTPALAPEPLVLPTPPASSIVRERRKVHDDEDGEEGDVSEDEDAPVRRNRHGRARSVQQQQPAVEQVIAGVPNELLLPGAIAMLAVVIVGVFTISRVSSSR